MGYNFLDFACPSLLNILSLDHVETSSGNSRGAIANTETTASTPMMFVEGEKGIYVLKKLTWRETCALVDSSDVVC